MKPNTRFKKKWNSLSLPVQLLVIVASTLLPFLAFALGGWVFLALFIILVYSVSSTIFGFFFLKGYARKKFFLGQYAWRESDNVDEVDHNPHLDMSQSENYRRWN